MDQISGLPDELLVKILSFVPTKVAISTTILSKRWKFLWMYLPNLDYIGRDESLLSLRDFINKTLPLHKAPIIESLRLGLCELSDPHIRPQDIKLWVESAVSRYVHELILSYYSSDINNEIMLPSSLFTCKSLVILKLRYVVLADVPSTACLSSLKTLKLESITYRDEKSLEGLLSICPVLEDLVVRFSEDENMEQFTVTVPSLQKLTLFISDRWYLDGYEIDTPSLNYLKLNDWSDGHASFKSMPKLREAYVDVLSFQLKSIIGSITSVKDLTVCSEDVYGDGFVFDQLEHLKLCVCKDESSNLLARFLKDSPNLRVLDISILDLHGDLKTNDMVPWNQPSSVPECLSSSLQILSWASYFGRPQDRDIAVYILKNARHLKTATIWANTGEHFVPNLKMVKELTLSSRASSTCELVFIED